MGSEMCIRDSFKSEGMRVVDSEKMLETMNKLTKLHSNPDSGCDNVEFTTLKETKVGLAWKYIYKCKNCDFVSPEFKLYNEIPTKKPGPNAARINLQLQIGLQETPMGNRRARILLNAMDIPHPAKS